MSLGLIVVGIYTVMQSNLKEVNIKDNGELITFTTHQQTVNEVLQEALIRVGNYDDLNVDFDEEVYDGMTVEITRAQPVVINDAGIRRLVMTTESTVDDFLSEQDIEVREDDEISVAPMAVITDDMEIEITRVDFEFESEYEEITLETEYVYTDDLLKGEREVSVEGSPMIVQTVLENTIKNGEVYDIAEVETNIIDEGVAQVVLIGTYVPAPPPPVVTPPTEGSSGGGEALSVFTASVTGYTADCAGCTGRVACTGMDVSGSMWYTDATFGSVRIIAADRGTPCGTIMYLEGVGNAVVLDRGGKVTGNVLDLLMDTNPWNWGRRSIRTEVLRWGW